MSGPFVVSRRRPTPHAYSANTRVLSQRAVADLDEARERVIDCCPDEFPDARVFAKLAEAIAAIGPAGGSVPLPDGSEIEVKAVTWTWLASEAGIARTTAQRTYVSHTRLSGSERRAILGGWNSRHGIKPQDERGDHGN